ncbi:DNRLRE domain-containing protein [Paenibacillus sp. HWE-109]|uniref:polysaccharide lyase family 8 super-sandwich domain-containing protein n=1 Tax=Paenibacillus sp. HWE-109 TaxID=1306526 RepID=UPI001EDDFB2C|nr:polysaccharide lyase family 8 super-sandwich domain-containing protein [Paenibacillus sp. HWE-109]UKS27082.1 DNRLRE domain-containing protein [Paenibacillus sp. HWE-109]
MEMWKKGCLVSMMFVLLFSTILVGKAPSAQAADEFDSLRAKWNEYLVGKQPFNSSDTDISAAVAAISDTVTNGQNTGHWNTLNKAAGRTYLWSDLASSCSASGSYGRLKAMARAYVTQGTAVYQDPSLGADIVSALDWVYANKFNENSTYNASCGWDYEIGMPLTLTDTMVMMYSQLSAVQIANYIKPIDKFVPNADTFSGAPATGANRLDKALVVAVRGVLGKSAAKMAISRDAISQVLLYVTSGDGFYTDGSFIQHSNIAYTGSYGAVLLGDMAKLLYLLGGSTWQVTDSNLGNVYKWVADSYEPLVYRGWMMDMVYGRGVTRYSENGLRGPSFSILILSQYAPSTDAATFKSMVKNWLTSDPAWNPYAGETIFNIQLGKTLMADSGVQARGALLKNQVFAAMDRVVHQRDGFALGLSLFSNRISAFEFGNGENVKGWFQGAGVTYLYNGDTTQYGGNYWPTINSYRLPGTTTDGSGSGTPVNWKSYPNTKTWVGGSSIDGLNGSVGMDFAMVQVTGSTLQGKKSWFLFDDKVVALGSGITSTDNRSVETIIENRKLNAQGTNLLTVNGVAKPAMLGWSESMTGVQYAHLAGSAAGSDIGYYFPQAATVQGLRETRTGSWSQINTGQSTTPVSERYLSLAFAHGTNPTNGSYAYVLLPGKTAAATANYAANATISILENSAAAHAVQDTEFNRIGVNFWNDGAKTVQVGGTPFITSDTKASVTTQETGGQLSIGVSDPTQANTEAINLEINRTGTSTVTSDPGIVITQYSPTIKMTIYASGAKGKTFQAKINLGAATASQTITASADATLRDGTYASTNYGTATVLDTKLESTSYDRNALVSFDLSAVTSTVGSAKVKLVPTAVGMAGITNQAHLIANPTWMESTVTWNNQPASGTLLATWTVPAAGTAVELDVKSQVIAALSGNKKLSLKLSSPSNQGSLGWVQYGSKEYGVAAYRPVIVITP